MYSSEILNQAREIYKVPAIALSVMNEEAIYYQEVQGVRFSGNTSPATLGDYFHIGSCSKSVLAVMAAKIIEQEKITWHTRLFDVLSELKDNAHTAYNDITLEDLFRLF